MGARKQMKKYNFNFMSNRRTFWLLSLIVITVGAICNILLGTQIDMRFTGGTIMRYAYYEFEDADIKVVDATGAPLNIFDGETSSSDVSATDKAGEVTPAVTYSLDAQQLAQVISDALGVRATVAVNDVISGSDSEAKTLVVTFTEDESSLGHNADLLIRKAVRRMSPNASLMLKESNSYSPILGREFFMKCIIAVALTVIFMLLFLSFRFRGSGGISLGGCGLLGVIYDLVVVYFAFVIFRYPIDNNFIAAALAIMGYSLNTKIAVFGKIRENKKLFGSRMSSAQFTDLSINETFPRTLSTNLCLLMVLTILAVVSAIVRLESMLRFSLPMIIGVLSVAYTSLIFSTTLWVTWSEFRQGLRYNRNSE